VTRRRAGAAQPTPAAAAGTNRPAGRGSQRASAAVLRAELRASCIQQIRRYNKRPLRHCDRSAPASVGSQPPATTGHRQPLAPAHPPLADPDPGPRSCRTPLPPPHVLARSPQRGDLLDYATPFLHRGRLAGAHMLSGGAAASPRGQETAGAGCPDPEGGCTAAMYCVGRGRQYRRRDRHR